MMSKLRSLIVWSVVFTQVWSPVLAQTLPISVDRSVPGARPSVGVSHGVPVVNIAPPSAGGVSNNRYTQFNVGPSGVVLNNSGGASPSQLAGQVDGNPMLGNRHAGTILNQVTAPNPSQLLGTLEVAGNRANVIVANPAGITCNGCGFLNADRATLTTGKPRVGPDGGIGFDVAGGRLAVEGQGLNGMNLSQVDLIARTLEINAGIWANRLNVTAGASRVDYGSDAISAQAGDGPAPIVALDTAALGGMYANSIRLIGTEAGVGVNIGGNLAALTGDLQVNAAGDVRIAPRATVQAAGDLRVNSGGTLAVQGAAQATGAVTLAATADVSVPGAVGAGALLGMNAGGDVAVGPLGSLRTQGALRVAAGRDLSMSARLLTSGQDARMQSGRNLTVADQAAMPPPVQGGAADSGAAAQAGAASVEPSNAPADSRGGVSLEGGRVSAKDGVTLQAGRDLVLPQQVVAAGTLLTEADGNLTLAAGTQLQSAGNVTMRAGHDVSLGGTVLTDAALSLTSGNDLVLGSTGKLQGERVDTSAGRDLALGGTLVSTADVQARATRDTRVDGKLSAGGALDLDAGRHLSVGAAGQADASGKTRMLAAGDLSLAGTTRGNLGMRVEAGGRVDLSGATASANGPLDLIAGRAMHLSADSQALAGGAMQARAGSTLTAAGTMTSLGDLILDSSGNQRLAGQHFAAGNLVIQTRSELTTLAGSQQRANGSILARADSGALAGTLEAGQAATLRVEKDLTVDGTVLADAGALEASSGGAMLLGSASALQAGGSLTARAGSKLLANGTISGRQDITLKAGTNAQLNGKTVANATLRIDASDDLTIGETGLAQGSARLLLRADQDLRIAGIAGTAKGAEMGADRGMLQAQAARDLLITGTATAGSPVILGAQRDIRIDGVATALDGVLTADAGAELRVAATGRMQASQSLNASAGANLDTDGVIAAGTGLTLAAGGDVRVGGLAAALGEHAVGDASITAGRDVVVKANGQLQAAGTLIAEARRDLLANGVLSSVGDMLLAAAHVAHLEGSAATDATLTLTGRDVAVGMDGLAQAGRTLNASASGELEVAGRMLSGGSQSLTAGDTLRVDGTAAALRGDLSLTAQRGDLALHATSRQQAGGGLTAQAGGALTALGSVVAQHGMTLRAGTDATLGGLAATQTGDLDIHAAGALSTTTDGRLQSGAALDLSAGGALGNAGIATAAGRASLKAGTTLDNMGSVLAGGDLIASAAGQLANAGQFVAGVDTDGALNLPGSLTLAAGSIVHRGASLAGGTLSLSADGLDLTDGKLSAISKVALSTPGDVDSRNAVVQGGTLDVTAANLRNQGGELAATSDAAITLGGNLDNTGGRIGAAGTARIEAAAIANRHGILAGRDVTITATSSAPTRAVDNRAGLIQADNALTLRAASLDNSGTLTMDGDPSKGVLAKVIDILADRVGNQTGSVRAREDLTLAAKDLDNTGGEIVSQGNARILADGLNNAEGKLLADKRLTVTTKVLQGLGTLQSAGDLSFQYAGSLSQEGDIASGRDLALSVGGDMDNRARISAVRDLTITADSLNNQASGELLAGGANAITVARGFTNAGLIDGGSTRIAADRLENSGRIYGDTLSIQAGTLVNGAGAGGGAVIASRGNMNLGVGSLTNRDHALIYSGADLRIGGALDAQGAVVDQAASLLNASAVIEAVGDADISAASIRNQNDHYASETAQVSSKPKVYFRTLNSQVMYDADTNWLCETDRPVCGKDPLTFLENDSNHRFLLPSDKYPASRYGPPFDYAPFVVGDKKGPNVPIAPAVVPRITVCASADGSRGCQFEGPLVSAHRATRPIHVYATDASIWQVFGVTPPDGPIPTWTPHIACSDKPGVCAERQAARRRAYEQAFAQYQAPFQELNARIYAFNQEYKRRLVEGFYYYIVTETVTETRTTATDPAKILSGGGMALTGVVTNDKSQIAAGGMLSVQGPAIVNIGAAGTRSITRAGTQVFTDEHGRRRTESRSPYNETMAAEPIELPVGTSGSNVGVALVGSSPGASRPPAPGTVQIASVTLPGHAAVRSVSNPVSIPDSQLFAVSGKPDAPYIVATDPRFVGPHPSVSSDYLLDVLRRPGASPGTPMGAATAGKEPSDARLSDWSALLPPGAGFLTPTGQPRRLGDGFYEQRLVSDQILASSGQRFLENYSDYDAQYKALMTEGARFGQLNGLKVGVALSEAQQRQLTADLVWLVEETVTLPDGTTEAVLVPRVYLVVRPTDLKGDGTLMAGRDVTLAAEGDIVNSGTIGARAATVMTSANILNQAGGRIQGALVDLSAREYLTNLASLIKGAAVALSAGNDIALTSTTTSENFSSTWGTHLSGVSSVDAGRLNLQAGRDITLTAAQVSASEDAYLQAGRDVRLETVARNHGERIVGDARNRHELTASREIGATLTAGGDMTWIAGQDVNARAADATAGKQLAVHAGRDLNVAAGVAAGSTYAESYRKKRGFLSSSTSHTISSTAWEQAQASTLTGDTAVLTAGRDLNVTGSNVGAQHDLTASARRDVNILPGENTSDRYDYKMVKKSGLGAMGGLSYGTRRQTDSLDGKNVFHTASTVGSVEGDTLIRAERALNVTGSNVLARQGDVTLTGRGINIAAALDTTRDKELHEVKQSGASINASAPLISAMQTAGRMNEATGKTDNKVMQGLALATTGLAALNAYDAVLADPKSAGGVSLSIDLGTSKSQSATDRASSSTAGSTVAAGQDLTLLAQGAGSASDITLTGSRLSAGGNALLDADGNIQLRAAQNTFEQNTKNKSSSASVGIGVSADSENGAGVMVTIGVSGARGRADGKDTRWTYADVSAGNVLALRSGDDTSLIGATGRADRIIASVGKDLRLETLQDASTYDAKQQSIGVKANICVYGYCKSSVSGNVAQGRMNSDFRSASEQAGLKAGDGGFQLDIARNTTLIGAAVSSSERAALEGRNALGTGTLDVQDVKNTARYKADQIALSGGYSWGGDGGGAPKKGDAGKADVAANANGQAAGGADTARESGDKGGASAGLPVVAGASGKASSTTRSAISGGNVVIRDEVAQQDLTGLTATQTIAALNRDTSSDTLNALKPIFDKEKIEAGFEIASEVNRQVGQFLETRAREAKALEDALKNEPEGPRRDQLRAQHEAVQKWGPGGRYREALMAVSLATGANVTGSASGFVQAATVNYLQSLSAAKIKEIAPLLGGEGSTGHVALHALLGCAGAAAKSTGCGAAATGASAGIVISQLMEQVSGKSSNKLDPVKREARINLVTSVLAGLTAALDPKAVAAVNDAARVELENNQLALPLPPMPSAGGLIGGIVGGGRSSQDLIKALRGRKSSSTTLNEDIASALQRKWNDVFSPIISESNERLSKTPNKGDAGKWVKNPGSGQERLYGSDGRPLVDLDSDHNHGQGTPHAHNWDRDANGAPVRGPGVPVSKWPRK